MYVEKIEKNRHYLIVCLNNRQRINVCRKNRKKSTLPYNLKPYIY